MTRGCWSRLRALGNMWLHPWPRISVMIQNEDTYHLFSFWTWYIIDPWERFQFYEGSYRDKLVLDFQEFPRWWGIVVPQLTDHEWSTGDKLFRRRFDQLWGVGRVDPGMKASQRWCSSWDLKEEWRSAKLKVRAGEAFYSKGTDLAKTERLWNLHWVMPAIKLLTG